MSGWDFFEILRGEMSDELILQEFARAMGDDELRELCDYVMRCYDIDIEG